MMPRLVTFDCAQTIVDVRWSLDGFITDCMAHLGVSIEPEHAALYKRLYFQRLPEYLEINLARDPISGGQYWARLGRDWLEQAGYDVRLTDRLAAAGELLAYGPDSNLFRPYPDVVPCFKWLRDREVKVAVVSNWDYSLHRVLRMFGFEIYLDLTLASLEEGVEKPDPRLFHLALQQLGCRPDETVHVGDNPEDDVEGAKSAGIRPILIDRTGATPGAITTLDQLPEVLGWTG